MYRQMLQICNMTLRFALIGCGRIAQKHAEQISRVGVLAAVCDTDFPKAKQLSEKYAANAYEQLDMLLQEEKSIDVVCICTPNYLHAQHSIAALNYGAHVLCEKPLAITSADAMKMIEAANIAKKKLFVVKQNRFNAPVQAVKQLLDKSQLGKISSFQINCFWNRPAEYYNNTWKGKKALDGGTLFTQFSHFIDLLYWFLGDVEQTQSTLINSLHPYIEFEDTGVVNFKMTSGVIGSLHYTVNVFEKNMEGSFAIFGENGTVKIGGEYLNTIAYQRMNADAIDLPHTEAAANDYGFYRGSMSNHDKVYTQLIEAIEHDGDFLASAADGLKTVEIIEMIYASNSNKP